jgi:hypothetical protein
MIPMAVFKARKKEIHAGHGELNFPRLKQMDFLMNEKCYIFYPIGRKLLRQKTSPAGAIYIIRIIPKQECSLGSAPVFILKSL